MKLTIAQTKALFRLSKGAICRNCYDWDHSVLPDSLFLNLAMSTELVSLDDNGVYEITDAGRKALGCQSQTAQREG